MKSRRIDEIHGKGFNPANRGRTFSDDPKHPLWRITVTFPMSRPLRELIKAPTARDAKEYAKTKYMDATLIEVIGRARGMEDL
jgi:hypothetical protein